MPQVLRAYVQSRVDSARDCITNDTIENLLEDVGGVQEQLEKLPTICHFQYRNMGDFLLTLFDPLLQNYSEVCDMGSNNPANEQKLLILEGQLAWLVYIVGSVIGCHSYSSTQNEDGDELVDADLSKRVFRLMQMTEHRLIASGGQTKCDIHLELALLAYFQNFRRTYW